MERIWQELRKIEAKAEQIRIDAQTKAKDITDFAEQEAEELLANSKTYAQREAQQLQQLNIEEANKNRDMQLKTNDRSLEELERTAQKRIPKAQEAIIAAVLGKTKP